MPKISVIMPVYNTDEEYLREAIESILNQSFYDFEFIIINDGSKNNAEEVILSYKDERIKYVINEQNLGLIKTLNKGLKLAQGEYIARMDADDISLPERLLKQADFLDKNPEVGVLGTWFECFPRKRIMKSNIDNKEIVECLLAMHNDLGHPTVMIKNSLVKNIDLQYDENAIYVEDYALWLSLINKTKFANIPEILLMYRINKGGVCKNNKIKQCLNCQKIMFEAQGKYFNIDNQEVIMTIEKLKESQKISSLELLAINEFVNKIKNKIIEFKFNCEYKINRDFYKFAIKNCKKDFLFFKLFFKGEIGKLLKKD